MNKNAIVVSVLAGLAALGGVAYLNYGSIEEFAAQGANCKVGKFTKVNDVYKPALNYNVCLDNSGLAVDKPISPLCDVSVFDFKTQYSTDSVIAASQIKADEPTKVTKLKKLLDSLPACYYMIKNAHKSLPANQLAIINEGKGIEGIINSTPTTSLNRVVLAMMQGSDKTAGYVDEADVLFHLRSAYIITSPQPNVIRTSKNTSSELGTQLKEIRRLLLARGASMDNSKDGSVADINAVKAFRSINAMSKPASSKF
jgi:hypothetical protein